MGRFFSDTVEQALEDLYYNMSSGRGQETYRNLQRASAEGDGDATCLMARCLSGPQYIWKYHGFREDDKAVSALVHLAVSQGSALAVLLAMRCGELTPSMQQNMPFASLKEAWSIIYEKAEAGEPFCQYVIGNTYYWWDFMRIEGKDADSFNNKEEMRAYIREHVQKCEGWLQKAFAHGMSAAGGNLYSYYTKGEEGIIPPQPEKALTLIPQGAQLGYPPYEEDYAMELRKAKNPENLQWYRRAAEHGQLSAWFYVGYASELGHDGAAQDYAYAAACYQRGLPDPDNIGCRNRLGALYYKGQGVEQDYARAFQLIHNAYELGSDWGVFYLGTCCFYGRGTKQDFGKAREFLEQVDWDNKECFYCLGTIYAQGLGVPADIEKGVTYLKKAGDFPAAREELLKYKKKLFGKWVRR